MMPCSGLAVGWLGRCIRSSNPQLADEIRHRRRADERERQRMRSSIDQRCN